MCDNFPLIFSMSFLLVGIRNENEIHNSDLGKCCPRWGVGEISIWAGSSMGNLLVGSYLSSNGDDDESQAQSNMQIPDEGGTCCAQSMNMGARLVIVERSITIVNWCYHLRKSIPYL